MFGETKIIFVEVAESILTICWLKKQCFHFLLLKNFARNCYFVTPAKPDVGEIEVIIGEAFLGDSYLIGE